MRKTAVVIFAFVLLLFCTGCGSDAASTLTFERGGLEAVPVNDEVWNMVCVYTEYTNRTGEEMLPADDISVSAYQNGRPLSPIVFTGQEKDAYSQCDTAIPDGATAKIVWLFRAADRSEVTVRFSDGEEFLL